MANVRITVLQPITRTCRGPTYQFIEGSHLQHSPGHDLWKLMVEKSGLDVWDTMTTGDGAITFIEHLDPSQARMARFSIRMRYDAARMAERRSRAKQRL